jgi:hypothetical protein
MTMNTAEVAENMAGAIIRAIEEERMEMLSGG